MRRKIMWKGLDAETTESCNLVFTPSGIDVHSEILGWNHGDALHVNYSVMMDKHWQVRHFSVIARINGSESRHELLRDMAGNWNGSNGADYPQFKNCTFIDISLTPFTNSLPVNALMPNVGDEALFDVVYIDVMEKSLRKDTQRYKKIADNLYRFENNKGAFTADILVDADGIVTFYPELFKIVI